MSCPRIAIATCAGYADPEAGDVLLRAALEDRGCEVRSVVWDEAGTDWSEFDLCLVRSTWDYHEKHRQFLAWARRVEATAALHNPADLIAWNSDKTYLREQAEQGVQIVPTVWVDRDEKRSLEEIMAAEGWSEAVVKPTVDLGARNLHRVRSGEGSRALDAALQRSSTAMVQPLLPSLAAEGELSLIFIAGELTHAVRKRPAPGDFRVQSIWGGTVEPAQPDPDQARLANRAMAQLDRQPLYARVDLVADLSGAPCLIELELIEPNLYLAANPTAAEALASAALPLLS